ncbi:MAG: lipopolysaccharide biosynthesis protein [Pseudolabrys sp.]|nr:lipopolysaccharide biosynthesis protein [Pseudolabrys sp.]
MTVASADTPPSGLRGQLGHAWRLAQRWRGRILYAFLDQGLYSTTNFVLTVLYAWWLPLEDFGCFVVVWTAVFFIEAVQNSMIIDSLPAIVSHRGRHNRGRIDVAGFWVVCVFGAVSSALLFLAAAVLWALHSAYALPVLVLALVNPLQRMYLYYRRLCYIRDRQGVAAAAAAAYSITLLAGAGALAFFKVISVDAVLALPGAAASAAIATIVIAGIGRLTRVRAVNVKWLTMRIWNSGRWLAPAAVVSWLMSWGIFPLVALFSGPGAAGVIRALQNLLTPIVQFNSALNLALLPRVADKVADHGNDYARRFALRATAGFAALVLLYCGAILAAAPILLPLLYHKPEIAASEGLLWPLSFGIVWEASRVAASMSLLATRRTRVVLLSRLIALTVFAVGGMALGWAAGLSGVLWANAIATATGASIVIVTALRPRPAPV